MTTPVNNPQGRMHFRLDPGEPGILRSTTPEASQAAVRSQEIRNLARLKAKAFRDGRVPVRAGIHFERGLEGSTPVVRSAQTTVVSVEDRKPAVVTPRTGGGSGSRRSAAPPSITSQARENAGRKSVTGGAGAGATTDALLAGLTGGSTGAPSQVANLKRELGVL